MIAPEPIRLCLVARCAMVRDALRSVLGKAAGFRIVGEHETLGSLAAALRDAPTDAVVFEPTASGDDAVGELPVVASITPVLVIGTRVPVLWRDAGAAATLPRTASIDELRTELQALSRARPPQGAPLWPALSGRQRDVLRLAYRGLTSREIGEQLGIGERTVETHRAVAMKKLGVRSFHEVMLLLSRYGGRRATA